MTETNPEFRKIPSLDFLYEISEDGRIFRNVKSKKQSAIRLDTHHSPNGYYVTFVNIKGIVKRVMIHRVVAECWYGACPEGMEVDHIDRNTHNNHHTNLRYVTHSEQMKNRVLSERIIEQATRNCNTYAMTVVAKPIVVDINGESCWFPSMTQGAEYLAFLTGKKPEHIRSKMKKRYKNIFGYDVVYEM